MILRYMGHSFFTMTTEKGTVIATDPYGALERYPRRRVPAHVCTVSHHHFDHDGLECVTGHPLVIDQPGSYRPEADVAITGIPVCHDHHNGEHRGSNTIFVFEIEGLRIAHCGDLGHLPTPAQIKALSGLDVLLLPVGGTFTLDDKEAFTTMGLLKPKVTIPMHYHTQYTDMNIAPVDGFLRLAGVRPQPVSLLRLTPADMSERESVILMDMLPPEREFEGKE